MNLAVLGTGPFAVPSLERLAASDHAIVAVVTRPPRGRRPVAPPMQLAAQRLGLRVWQPETLNDDDARGQLRDLGPDLLVVCDYGEILTDATLAIAPLGGVNLHASLLPKYRGAAPVQWALLQGETETGNTVIAMTTGLDAGPCLGVQRVAIDPQESAGELEARLAKLGAELVLETVARLARGDRRGVPQDPKLKSKAPRLRKEQGTIDWNNAALQIHNQVRALDPWPRAWTWRTCTGEAPLRLILHKTRVADDRPQGEPPVDAGTILATSPGLLVQAGAGVLEILELQPEGKKRMTSAEFLRGTSLKPGDRLSTPSPP